MAKKNSRARKQHCETKRVCRATGPKAKPSAKQVAWRNRFKKAAKACRAADGDYGRCMVSELKR